MKTAVKVFSWRPFHINPATRIVKARRAALLKAGKRLVLCALALSLAIPMTTSFATGLKKELQPKLGKSAKITSNQVDFIPNTVEAFFENNGIYFTNYLTGSDGLFWPAGSGKNAVFAAGPWFIGKSAQDHFLHSASSDYSTEYQPGPIVTTYDGVPSDAANSAANPSDPKWNIMVLSKNASSSDPSYQSWVNNSSQTGAPLNKDGTPQVLGDLNAYWVMNDLATTAHSSVSRTTPLGLEVHNYVFGFNKTGPLGQALFMKMTFINRSSIEYDSCYFGWFSDIDLGNSNDDLDGCDTTRSLGYTYNGGAVDAVYGSAPPADGYDFLEGPRIPTGNLTDSAIVNGSWVHGYKNLPMTSFTKFVNNGGVYNDPPLGNTDWSRQAYNLLKGLVGSTGVPFLDNNNNPSKFVASGDPATGSGWLDTSPDDRRLVMSSGPFKMMPSDTQEIVIGFLIARGTSNTNSVTVLKMNDSDLKSFVNGEPVASIESIDTIYSVNSTINFHGSSAVYTGSITGTQWLIRQKPVLSSASLVVSSAGESHIQPDVPGLYAVEYIANANNGASDTAVVQFRVTANTPPVVTFQTSASSIAIGDSLSLNGSATIDADGDPLQYTWSVSGNDILDKSVSYDTLHGVLKNGNSVHASYVPVRASTLNISLTARDSFFTVTAPQQYVIVNPLKTANVQVIASYGSDMLPSGQLGFYSHGAIRAFPDNSVWTQSNAAYFQLNFNNFTQVMQSYSGAFLSSNFYVANNLLFVPYSISGVFISQLDGSGGIVGSGNISSIQFATTSDSIPYDVYYKSPYLFVSNGSAGVYVYNVSNPASPTYVFKYSNGQKWTTLWPDGDHLYSVNSLTRQLLLADVSAPLSVSLASVHIDRAYTTVKKLGQYFYLFKTDTIGIYDLSSFSSPVLKSEIPVPHTLNTGNVIYDISGDGKALMVGTAEGVYFYDVSNPAAPSQIGKFITGYENSRVFYDGTHVLASSFGRGLTGGYEGFTLFQPTITGVEPMSTDLVPSYFSLQQNYPNPFNPTTTIDYQLPVRSHVLLKVYDVLGREVETIVDAEKIAGSYRTTFDGSRFASGTYFYRLQAGTFTAVKKFVLVK